MLLIAFLFSFARERSARRRAHWSSKPALFAPFCYLLQQFWTRVGTRQLLVAFGVYVFVLGSFNHVQMSSGVQVQGHPAEQLPLGCCDVTFAHSS
jgi:hypothetical protein